MHIHYYAWIRTRIGKSEENLPLPSSVETLQSLADHLKDQGGGYQAAFSNATVMQAALNGHLVQDWTTAKITDQDKLSFFSAIAGG